MHGGAFFLSGERGGGGGVGALTSRFSVCVGVCFPLPRTTYKNNKSLDSFRGSSVKIGTIPRRLAWPLPKDDTHKSRRVSIFLYQFCWRCKGGVLTSLSQFHKLQARIEKQTARI